jgi:hypothetical protein
MIEAAERAAHKRISKMIWPIERRYAAREPLPNSKVGGLPCNFLAEVRSNPT